MSDAPNVETEAAEAEADKDEAAIWKELQAAEAGQVEDTPGEADGGEGQAGAGTPEGQAKPSTPGEDTTTSSASEETSDDPWAKADPKLREAFEAERERANRAENAVKVHGGRLSQAYHDLSELRAKLGEATGKATPEGEEATDREERRKQLLEEYGDSTGKLIPDIIALEEKVRSLAEAQASQASGQTEAVLFQQQQVLDGAHPDWGEIVKSQRYLDWVEQQPGYIRQTLEENRNAIIDGASCADILTRFKAETAPKRTPEQERLDERREEQREALRDPSLRGTKVTAEAESEEAIWREMQAKERREAAGAR